MDQVAEQDQREDVLPSAPYMGGGRMSYMTGALVNQIATTDEF
jgi:hypothetical protein